MPDCPACGSLVDVVGPDWVRFRCGSIYELARAGDYGSIGKEIARTERCVAGMPTAHEDRGRLDTTQEIELRFGGIELG